MECKKKRTALRGAFTKCVREAEEALSAEPIDQDVVAAAFELVTDKFEALREINSEVFDGMLKDATEQDLEAELDGCMAYEKKYVALKLMVQRAQKSPDEAECASIKTAIASGTATSSDTASVVSGAMSRRKFKLPVIEFTKFGGEIKDWLPFWNQFRKIDEDPDIDDGDKLQYLVQATLPGSKARQLVESFPIVYENYDKVLQSLKSRYGREDLLIEVYIRDLLSLVLKNGVGGKTDLATLYDRLEAHLRALETLGVTADKCAAMLFPLIESCIPRDLLRIWQRSPDIWDTGEIDNLMEKRMTNLMSFLRREVESEQRLQLATDSFRESEATANVSKSKQRQSDLSTASALLNSGVQRCVFCERTHSASTCDKAAKMRHWQIKKQLIRSNACFRCCQRGHRVGECPSGVKCQHCQQPHASVLCPSKFATNAEKGTSVPSERNGVGAVNQVLANLCTTPVVLQTLTVEVKGCNASRLVRVLLDTGSQRSYILTETAEALGCEKVGEEDIIHCLFGGVSTAQQRHNIYKVQLSSSNYECNIEALDQFGICSGISSVTDGPWTNELLELGIECRGLRNEGRIEVLLGADCLAYLYTGRRHVLKCGLVAIDTLLGWTLMGQVRNAHRSSTMAVSALLATDMPIERLWDLDVLGIAEPRERKSRKQRALETLEFFQRSVSTDETGRYVVRLPWIDDHPALPSNYTIARKRLKSVSKRLRDKELWQAYDEVFKQWEREGIIEEAEINGAAGHYLPHRPVIKQGSATTKIRPVFDASAREVNSPALNDCLETGMNYVELIPSMLSRFRQFAKGVVADIRQAFLQISVHESDRDFLRFLWLDESGNEKVFRHRRVVFGVNSSPFILGAVIDFHLARLMECADFSSYSKETLSKLRNSFYVDNVVTSLDDDQSVIRFKEEAITALKEAAFDLRGWESTVRDEANGCDVPVLGLTWNTFRDTLSLNRDNIQCIMSTDVSVVTKRVILSAAQRVFDPVGFTCPVSVCPKLLLRRASELNLKWDDPVDEDLERSFRRWSKQLSLLTHIEVPRWLGLDNSQEGERSLHTFCDASGDAYSAVVFLRIVHASVVTIRLVAAKSRIAPVKKRQKQNAALTTPRLELLAATIGARLFSQVAKDLSRVVAECYFWSDSSTVVAWIQRCEPWTVFVGNRVEEIRELTPVNEWRHVPGAMNPADLPSRGCTPEVLLQSKWWEGPSWLYDEKSSWPSDTQQCDEETIEQELRKSCVVANVVQDCTDFWHLKYFSKYAKTVRMIAWILRFVYNSRNPSTRRIGELNGEEFKSAELCVLKIVQKDRFSDVKDERLLCLHPSVDKFGVIRTESRVSNRVDKKNFRFPIILPKDHEVVSRLIFDRHVKSCHAGTDTLLSILREKFWIIGGRRTVRSVISRCVICKRHNLKRLNIDIPRLPVDRVRDAYAFEVTGIDFAGPLYLRDGEKAWVCLFTCAVYRAVHTELVTSLSTASFLQAFRRFVARRGRPKIIYTDNGTNFVGAANVFSKIDWEKVTGEEAVNNIEWKFNPPSSPWWGGFFERMVGLVKGLLRRTLGAASLTYEDLVTVLCECEATINSRPLTYMPGDSTELVTLTPAMFLGQVAADGLPECDLMDQAALCKRYRYLQSLVAQLRKRFRSEYLGCLKWASSAKGSPDVSIGEVVFVGDDNKKRLNWNLGRIVELIKGNDGVVRLVRVDTAGGRLLRPLARLYPLEVGVGEEECDAASEGNIEPRVDSTRATLRGRQIKLPLKYRC